MDANGKIVDIDDGNIEVEDIRAQFLDMSSMGHQKVIDSLKSENEMLKDALL